MSLQKKYTERYSFSNLVCVRISSYLPAKSVKYVCGTSLPLSFIIKSRVFLLKLQNPTSCASVTGWGSWTSQRSWMTHEYHHTWLSTWTLDSDRAVVVGLLDKTVFPVVLQFSIPSKTSSNSSNLSCFFSNRLLVLLMQSGGRECLIVYSNYTFRRWTKCKWCRYQKHLFITKPMWALGKAFTWCTCIVSDILQALKKETVYFLISFSMTCLSFTLNGWFASRYSAPFHWKDQCSKRGSTIESLMSKIVRTFSLSLRRQIQHERDTGRCARKTCRKPEIVRNT